MLQKTKGIALHYHKYSESSVIAKIFTKEFGLQSFIINGVRQKKAKSKLGLLRPLSFLNLEIYKKSKRGLNRIKEISISKVLERIHYDINKSLLAVFIAEVLLKALLEEEKEKPLFCYIETLVSELENLDRVQNTFPLVFLINLSAYLGFYPSKENSELSFYDLQNGCFSKKGFSHNHFISGEDLQNFKTILFQEKKNMSQENRKKILLILLDYYRLHHYELKNLKSHNVIEQLRQ
jgi:DNA repair protein RecO (recombination protein O)|tara:strand:- start:1049 stop:1756 length:708 start_codon:yes stop_codon:yes gene_type:complete